MGNERFVSKRSEFLGRCLISFSFDQNAAFVRLGVVRCRRAELLLSHLPEGGLRRRPSAALHPTRQVARLPSPCLVL